MYYITMKEILRNKTVWVVRENGEWHSIAVGVCFTKTEAEEFLTNYKGKKAWYVYTIIEQSLNHAFDKFDEQVKNNVIHSESETIAKEANNELRRQIVREVEKKYDDVLKPIEETIHKLIRQGV